MSNNLEGKQRYMGPIPGRGDSSGEGLLVKDLRMIREPKDGQFPKGLNLAW